jgi:uncharacterized protein (DUF1697 family)
MIKYVAFLRAINVGGRNMIRMEELRAAFESLRLKNVRTYIQSGNVLFEAVETDAHALTKKIESKLSKSFGFKVPVFLRTMGQMENILQLDPFATISANEEVATFVVLLSHEPDNPPSTPVIFQKESAELLAVSERAAYILCRRKDNGQFSFPNAFFEKELGVSATTRNWRTMKKIMDFAGRSDNRVARTGTTGKRGK